MDDYLLGKRPRPLPRVLRIRAAERARAHPAGAAAAGRLDGIRLRPARPDLAVPPDLGRETDLFEAALASFGMSGDRHGGLDKAQGQVMRGGAWSSAMQRGSRPPGKGHEVRCAHRLGGEREVSMPAERGRSSGKKKKSAESWPTVDESRSECHAAGQPDAKKPRCRPLRTAAELPDDGRRFFREIETTKEWAENNYHHLPIEAHTYDLITENKFWLDFAQHDGEAGFGSRHLGEAARSFHEAMLALAVLDLPFEAAQARDDDRRSRSSPSGPPAV